MTEPPTPTPEAMHCLHPLQGLQSKLQGLQTGEPLSTIPTVLASHSFPTTCERKPRLARTLPNKTARQRTRPEQAEQDGQRTTHNDTQRHENQRDASDARRIRPGGKP